ncbi:MAG: hypothetical protein KDK06_12450, partial [Gammaproteobacteria bacterium]|nr:hypothetical protein [Gammaproteobacteria bacterium]
TATVATQAASVTLTSELQFSAFNFNNGGGSGPYDAIDIALAVSFDSTLAATRKAVDSIKFGHDEFATTDVYFDYRPSVEVTPGNFNFQLDVYRDLPSGVDGDGLGVIFGSDDFLLRFAGLPFQLQDRIDAGGGGGLPELLPARQMLYTTSLPGFGSGYFVDGADQSSSALAVAAVPLPAAGWLCLAGMAMLTRQRRRTA